MILKVSAVLASIAVNLNFSFYSERVSEPLKPHLSL